MDVITDEKRKNTNFHKRGITLTKNKNSAEEDKNILAAQEALTWMIQLQEDPENEAMVSSFDVWLNEDPANVAAWGEIAHTSDIMRAVSGEGHSLNDDTEKSSEEKMAGSRKVSRLQIYMGLFCFIIFSGFLFTFLPDAIKFANADYSTSIGETRQLRLADGSLVYLGAKSAINVDYETDRRQISLLAGQAFFQVEKDPKRPFRVRFQNTETIVTGTAFEVNIASKGAAVSVAHGSVRVKQYGMLFRSRDLERQELKIGQKLQIQWNGKRFNSEVKMEDIAAWRRGRLVVVDRSVKDVIDELKRHYKGLIVNGLGSIGSKRITGVYDLDDPFKALQAIAATHGSKARKISKWLVIMSPI